MKFMTKEIEKRFEKIGRQEGVSDPIVVVKYFNPCGAETWFITEYYPEDEEFFGYISTQPDYNNEFGYFSILEMKSIRIKPFGLSIERDLHFQPKKLSVALRERNIPLPSYWKKYIDYDVPDNIDVEELLDDLSMEIKRYCKANNLTKQELQDLCEDTVDQSVYDAVCDEHGLYLVSERELATDIMRYHFWDTLDTVTGGLYA